MRGRVCALIQGAKGSLLERVYERLSARGLPVEFREAPQSLDDETLPPVLIVESSHPQARQLVENLASSRLVFVVGASEEAQKLARLGAVPLAASSPEALEAALTGALMGKLCKLEELQARLRLLEDLPWFGIYILDADLNIVYASPWLQSRLDRPLDELVGRPVTEVVHPEFKERAAHVLREKFAGKEFPPYLVRLLRADDTPIWSEVFSRRVELEGAPHIVGVVRDVEAERRQDFLLRTLFRLVRDLLTEQRPRALLQQVADAIVEVGGFRRAVISLYDFNWPDPLDAPVREVVTAGLSEEEEKQLLSSEGLAPEQRRAYFSEEFRIGPEAYYIPYHRNPFEIENTGLPGTVEMEGWSPLDLLFVPLRVEGKIIGHISLDDPKDPIAPTPATLEPISHLAAVAALAVKRAHEEELRLRHERHLRAAQAMGRQLAQAVRPDEALIKALSFLRERLHYAFVGAGFLKDRKVATFWYSRDSDEEVKECHKSSPAAWKQLAKAIESKAPQLISCPSEDTTNCPLAREFGIACSLVVPISVADEPTAFLVVGEDEPYALTQLDLETVVQVAGWCEVTLDIMRMRGRLAGLYELSHTLSQIQDRKQLLRQLMQGLRRHFAFDYYAFFRLLDGELELEALDVSEEVQLYPHIKPGWRLPKGEGVVSWVAQERAPVILPDVRSYPKYVPGNPDVRSELAVPVVAGDELLGVLNVESRQPAAFGGDELAILQVMAGQLAVALQNLEAKEKLKELAIRDPLTALYNRRFLEEVIGQEVAAARRYRRPLALLYVDVNGFRAVNNTHGHLVGDEVLRRVAGYLQDNVREADYVFRIGGDEFLVLLPETDGEAEEVAKRLKQGIGEVLSDVGVPIGLSIGIAVWEPDEEFDLEALIAEADKRMYEDKRRNSD